MGRKPSISTPTTSEMAIKFDVYMSEAQPICRARIRPVLAGTVPFSGFLSRCPVNMLGDIEMSRFLETWVPVIQICKRDVHVSFSSYKSYIFFKCRTQNNLY